jgi:hypothetical protein
MNPHSIETSFDTLSVGFLQAIQILADSALATWQRRLHAATWYPDSAPSHIPQSFTVQERNERTLMAQGGV